MNSIIIRIKQVLTGAALAAVLMAATSTPSRSDGPLVPSPKLPPPSSSLILDDGTIIYEDGTILYTDGTYVCPDGTTGHI